MTPRDDDRAWSDDDPALLRQTADYYARRLRERGTGARGMDWRDEASQYLRFERLVLHLNLAAGASLLDVGCGSGELFEFCRRQGLEVDYLGIDVSAEMVEACNRRFGPGAASRASLAELVREGRSFDYVVASGTFNVRQETPEDEWRRFLERSVVEMYFLARRALAFNAMSTRVDYRYDHLYYARADEMAALADLCGTRDFVVDHAYPLFEMTTTLLRPQGREER